jgi:hypothetical protein
MKLKIAILSLASSAYLAQALETEEIGLDEMAIQSVMSEIERGGGLHHWGAVHVSIPGVMEMTCNDLVASPDPDTRKVNRAVATTNVVISLTQVLSTNAPAIAPSGGGKSAGEKTMLYAHQAVFDGVNNTITLLGTEGGAQPKVVQGPFISMADRFVYNRATRRFDGISNVLTRIKLGTNQLGGLLGPKPKAVSQ